MNSYYKNTLGDISNYKQLYQFLQSYTGDIIEWLNTPWVGKDKQETLLRLMAGLGLISKLKDYDICKGNFNKQTVKKQIIKDIFLSTSRNVPCDVMLKDKGDSSDLTGIHKSKDKHLLLTTSKNLNKVNIGKLDIDRILTNFEQYKKDGYTMTLCICIRDASVFKKMKIEESSTQLKEYLYKKDTIIIDWIDLKESYNQFKSCFLSLSLDSIINNNKPVMCLKLHQRLGVLKTIKLKTSGEKKILWGHIQRSGKSYIIGGCIIEDSKINNKTECNYLVITTAPKETIEQQVQVFNCMQLSNFNIVVLHGKNKKPKLTEKNIILCSKQFLQTKLDESNVSSKNSKPKKEKHLSKTKSIAWLKKMSFDMRFIDESHNGGSTELAKKTLDTYGSNAFTIQITATYAKPVHHYNILRECSILWDLEDINMCKKIKDEKAINTLVKKHGNDFLTLKEQYSDDNIIAEYSRYPDLHILTTKITPKIVDEIIKRTRDNDYGWSSEACFLLKQCSKKNDDDTISIMYLDEFQDEQKCLHLWYMLFGKVDKFGIPDKEYPSDVVFMTRIKEICNNPTIDSRCIGMGEYATKPMIILVFLTQNNIDKISNATEKLLKRYNVIPEYDILKINSKVTSDPKQSIEDARIKAKHSGKKGVLVLSGRQCSLGVSIEDCDIVFLLNPNNSFDMINQMMFRCMTEGNDRDSKKKKCGFVVDLTIHRVIENNLIKFSNIVKPELHPRDGMKYIMSNRLVTINGDHWLPGFNEYGSISEECEKMYKIHFDNIETSLFMQLNRLTFKKIILDGNLQALLNNIFTFKNINETDRKAIYNYINNDKDDVENIKKGIAKLKIDNRKKKKEKKEEKEEDVKYMNIIKHIIPLICLLTIHNEDTSLVEMFNLINGDATVYKILLDQTQSWWGEIIDSDILKLVIKIFKGYLNDDPEVKMIVRVVKESFFKNVNNSRNLSKMIDKYLIPHEFEKKKNAEVSTPRELRQKMLDKIPAEFWKASRKVFEPCSGKGGFVLDIIDRFMEGLKSHTHLRRKRYKTIVEECLYFSDINPTNIFICRLLIDPYNEYKLNYNEGNTLELDIKDKWGIDGFHAVTGNPPYNSTGQTATGNTIWQLFVKQSLNWINKNGYLLFVHPSGWRKPNTKRGKFYGLYKLMTQENQMIYLSIHGIKEGKQTFKCGTRYDWYLIKKSKSNIKTKVNDEKNNKIIIDMYKLDWLPNYNIDTIQNILAKENGEKCDIIYDRTSYGADKKWMSKVKTSEFKYPCIHSTPKKGIRYMYSRVNDKGHFGLSKVIFGDSGIYNPVIDIEGKYGMTQHAMAIQVDNLEEASKLSKTLTSEKMKILIDSCLFSSYAIDWNIFKDFKKGFWKEFI